MKRSVITRRLSVLLLMAPVALFGARSLGADDKVVPPGQIDPRIQRELERLKKAVEQKLGREEKGFFVVALSVTYFQGTGRGQVGGAIAHRGFIPKTSVSVEKAEGRAAAAELIVNHMNRPIALNGNMPAPQRDWKLLGRFETTDKAEQSAVQARLRYQPPAGR